MLQAQANVILKSGWFLVTIYSEQLLNLKLKMNCKNCGELVQGRYCSHCGQNAKVGKISVSNLLHEFSSSIFQVDRGFFYTLKALFERPGASIKEYLNGKRKKHFKPIAYVLTLSTFYFLISQMTGQNTWMEDLISGFSSGASNTGNEADIPPVLNWFSKNFAYTTLLLLPVFSLASYISFSGLGRNYLEHIVINSYVTGQQAIFYSLFGILKTFINIEIFELLPVLTAFSYTIWVFWRFFKEGNRIINILRSILTYILYLIFSIGILIVFMGISEI